MENPKMQFILSGFSHVKGLRIFSFEGIAEDRTRIAFTVGIDLALSRKYGIRLQEMPLLCREVLNRREEVGEQRALVYSEEDMRIYANTCAAARETEALKKKAQRRPVSENVGAAWRAPAR